MTLGVELDATPEVGMLAETNRRAKLHETLARFLEIIVPKSCLIEIENAHHMDEASDELLSFLTTDLGSRPWLFAVAHRPTGTGFRAPDAPTVVKVELKPLSAPDALRMAQLATQQNPVPAHVLEVVATRSGGNPQFLRDLLRTAIESGGIDDLPDSAEAAAMAQIDGLAPDDRALVRRAAVFGLTFHPRMLAWLDEEGEEAPPIPTNWERLHELFEEQPDGYLRFRRSLLRDAAYEGLPYKLRRKLHGAVAAHLEAELDFPEEEAGTLSLHYLEAGEYRSAFRYAKAAAERAEAMFAHIEAAQLYLRALAAAPKLEDVDADQLTALQEVLGDAWYQGGEFGKASEAYAVARTQADGNRITQAALLLKLSYVEEKLGQMPKALVWAEQARTALEGVQGVDSARQSARIAAWYATILQREGRTTEALERAERAVNEAEQVDEFEALGDAYLVMGWAHAELGKEGALELTQRSLEAYQRCGNRSQEATVLSNLGIVCQWQGRWDEALSYYERAREASSKLGSSILVAMTRANIAEILIDRGEWAEAESILVETLPVWKASKNGYFLAGSLGLLGLALLRLGRFDDALARLEESKAGYIRVGADGDVPAIDARIAECRVAMGRADDALELVRDLIERAASSSAVERILPLIHRVHGHALLLKDDLWGARDALEASIAAAKERNNDFEAALTMLSLIELDRLEAVEPANEIVTESRSMLSALKVRAVPPVPLPVR
jgi:tetratricopeptide (TPR) repeat protein